MSLDVQLTDVLCFAVEVRIVAVEPVDTAMRLEISFVENAPNGGAMHPFINISVDQVGGKIVAAL